MAVECLVDRLIDRIDSQHQSHCTLALRAKKSFTSLAMDIVAGRMRNLPGTP